MNESLTAISPIDGRYKNKLKKLSEYFSEYALMRYRVWVEIEYFLALTQLDIPSLRKFPSEKAETLRTLYRNFTPAHAEQIKTIENVINHDVKAVEYYLREQFVSLQLEPYVEFIHFGLTSQDINNTAIPMLLRNFHNEVLLPLYKELLEQIEQRAKEWRSIAMLAHTHGQPASPTTLGKEMNVFAERIKQQVAYFNVIPFAAKFGGATGNFNAHVVAFPNIAWKSFAKGFVENTLQLKWSYPTTQIEHYDHLAAYLDNVKRLNTIMTDLCRDMWMYISMEYFHQKIQEQEVGSSAMPHKVNPIDFENAEGNLGIANALLEFMSAKLPVSRLQRDLTDSTVLRNLGVPLAHTCLAIQNLLQGQGKISVNLEKIYADLDKNWAVVAEAIQTYLRSKNYPHPYEELKRLTRKNQKITRETLHHFIDSLNIEAEEKNYLKTITPFNYTGLAGI